MERGGTFVPQDVAVHFDPFALQCVVVLGQAEEGAGRVVDVDVHAGQFDVRADLEMTVLPVGVREDDVGRRGRKAWADDAHVTAGYVGVLSLARGRGQAAPLAQVEALAVAVVGDDDVDVVEALVDAGHVVRVGVVDLDLGVEVDVGVGVEREGGAVFQPVIVVDADDAAGVDLVVALVGPLAVVVVHDVNHGVLADHQRAGGEGTGPVRVGRHGADVADTGHALGNLDGLARADRSVLEAHDVVAGGVLAAGVHGVEEAGARDGLAGQRRVHGAGDEQLAVADELGAAGRVGRVDRGGAVDGHVAVHEDFDAGVGRAGDVVDGGLEVSGVGPTAEGPALEDGVHAVVAEIVDGDVGDVDNALVQGAADAGVRQDLGPGGQCADAGRQDGVNGQCDVLRVAVVPVVVVGVGEVAGESGAAHECEVREVGLGGLLETDVDVAAGQHVDGCARGGAVGCHVECPADVGGLAGDGAGDIGVQAAAARDVDDVAAGRTEHVGVVGAALVDGDLCGDDDGVGIDHAAATDHELTGGQLCVDVECAAGNQGGVGPDDAAVPPGGLCAGVDVDGGAIGLFNGDGYEVAAAALAVGEGERIVVAGQEVDGAGPGVVPAFGGQVIGDVFDAVDFEIAVEVLVDEEDFVVVAVDVELVGAVLGWLEVAPPHLAIGVAHVAALPDIVGPDGFALNRGRPGGLRRGRQVEQAAVVEVDDTVVDGGQVAVGNVVIPGVVELAAFEVGPARRYDRRVDGHRAARDRQRGDADGRAGGDLDGASCAFECPAGAAQRAGEVERMAEERLGLQRAAGQRDALPGAAERDGLGACGEACGKGAAAHHLQCVVEGLGRVVVDVDDDLGAVAEFQVGRAERVGRAGGLIRADEPALLHVDDRRGRQRRGGDGLIQYQVTRAGLGDGHDVGAGVDGVGGRVGLCVEGHGAGAGDGCAGETHAARGAHGRQRGAGIDRERPERRVVVGDGIQRGRVGYRDGGRGHVDGADAQAEEERLVVGVLEVDDLGGRDFASRRCVEQGPDARPAGAFRVPEGNHVLGVGIQCDRVAVVIFEHAFGSQVAGVLKDTVLVEVDIDHHLVVFVGGLEVVAAGQGGLELAREEGLIVVVLGDLGDERPEGGVAVDVEKAGERGGADGHVVEDAGVAVVIEVRVIDVVGGVHEAGHVEPARHLVAHGPLGGVGSAVEDEGAPAQRVGCNLGLHEQFARIDLDRVAGDDGVGAACETEFGVAGLGEGAACREVQVGGGHGLGRLDRGAARGGDGCERAAADEFCAGAECGHGGIVQFGRVERSVDGEGGVGVDVGLRQQREGGAGIDRQFRADAADVHRVGAPVGRDGDVAGGDDGLIAVVADECGELVRIAAGPVRRADLAPVADGNCRVPGQRLVDGAEEVEASAGVVEFGDFGRAELACPEAHFVHQAVELLVAAAVGGLFPAEAEDGAGVGFDGLGPGRCAIDAVDVDLLLADRRAQGAERHDHVMPGVVGHVEDALVKTTTMADEFDVAVVANVDAFFLNRPIVAAAAFAGQPSADCRGLDPHRERKGVAHGEVAPVGGLDVGVVQDAVKLGATVAEDRIGDVHRHAGAGRAVVAEAGAVRVVAVERPVGDQIVGQVRPRRAACGKEEADRRRDHQRSQHLRVTVTRHDLLPHLT